MMNDSGFLAEHVQLTRRFFLACGVASGVVVDSLARAVASAGTIIPGRVPLQPPAGEQRGVAAEPWFTPPSEFRDVSRGTPVPHTLSEEKRSEVGLTRATWRLEVTSDPDHPAKLGRPLTTSDGTAFTFEALLKLGETHAVRFPKLMTCLNLGCPLGMGLWEGVPLRDVVWLTQPREDLRRVFYYGFHNNDPAQMFRSSLPIGRVLEDPFDLPPVILCYKLNGDWLDAKRGGPVRIVVPEAYGFKSVKWLTHVVLSNLSHANDTYAEQNNDIDSPLKTFAASLSVPANVRSSEPIQVSGYAQVGISGLSGVQVAIDRVAHGDEEDDPSFSRASWVDAELLAPPEQWAALPENRIPEHTAGFDEFGKPQNWPMRLAKVHWAKLLPGLPAGDYTFRCRSIDEKRIAQPMPRPFRKSGHAAIESVAIHVED
jgi:DMSO/TMAO reductase YedYZ molybdopterin-dependent catalytic subunit